MIPIESFIRADVQVRSGNSPPLNFGAYRFSVLPRIGELIDLYFGEQNHQLKVMAIRHFAYTEDSTPTPWDTVIVLFCEEAS